MHTITQNSNQIYSVLYLLVKWRVFKIISSSCRSKLAARPEDKSLLGLDGILSGKGRQDTKLNSCSITLYTRVRNFEERIMKETYSQ